MKDKGVFEQLVQDMRDWWRAGRENWRLMYLPAYRSSWFWVLTAKVLLCIVLFALAFLALMVIPR